MLNMVFTHLPFPALRRPASSAAGTPLRRRSGVLAGASVALCLAAAGCGLTPPAKPASRADVSLEDLPPGRRFAPALPAPPARANSEIARDFLDLHFRMEGGSTLPVFTRFEGPVSLRVTGRPAPGMITELNALLTRLEREAGIAITRTSGSEANITIQAVPREEISRALPKAACFVVPNVSSLEEYRRKRRNSKTRWPELRDRGKLAIFIPNDTSPQEVRDCLHEELAQALGPLNDLYRLPDSIFNDDNAHVVLTGFDMLILRAAYAPELHSGMSRGEVAEHLPALLARLNPAGERIPAAPLPETPPAWSAAIETALVPGTPADERLRAANEAAAMARREGWQDHRRAFTHYTMGRALQAQDPALAHQHFQTALRYLPEQPGPELHRARIYSRLAAYDLARGDASAALPLLRSAAQAAVSGQNAALLATLRLQEAEALEQLGQHGQARAVRLDSLGWARYGFGPEWAGRAQQKALAAAGPQTIQAKTR